MLALQRPRRLQCETALAQFDESLADRRRSVFLRLYRQRTLANSRRAVDLGDMLIEQHQQRVAKLGRQSIASDDCSDVEDRSQSSTPCGGCRLHPAAFGRLFLSSSDHPACAALFRAGSPPIAPRGTVDHNLRDRYRHHSQTIVRCAAVRSTTLRRGSASLQLRRFLGKAPSNSGDARS